MLMCKLIPFTLIWFHTWTIYINPHVHNKDIARAFLGGRVAHLEDQIDEENEEKLRKND